MTVSQSSLKPESFKDIQYHFTQHMRDPKNTDAPTDIEPRRIAIYTDLIYRNIESFIANSFPVLRKITVDDAWHEMIRDYIKNHISHTPYFPKMPLEFLQYLESERDGTKDPGFYFELAHYEWVESQLMFDQRNISFEGINNEPDLLEGIPVVSPLVMPLIYQWPVHRISPDYLPTEKPEQATYLVVYRDCDFEIGFIELNQVSAKLLEELTKNNENSGKQILLSIAEQLKHPDPNVVLNGGLEIMQDFFNKNVILGIKKL